MKKLIVPLICLLLASCFANAGEATTPPNVILILSDDQGWGDLSLNGNTNLSTPNIDRLAKNGARFEHFFVSPVCSPTRAEILTGRYHPRGGVYGTSTGAERLDLDETTIAEVFRSAGYATACYGKWHNGMQYPYHPNARGFDDFYGFCSGHWADYFDPALEHNGQLVEGKGFILDDLTDKAMQYMERNKEKPFFLYLPYNTPHSPMQVPDRWWNKFQDKEIEMRYDDAEKEDIEFTKAALAMCENIDWNVGRILGKLKELKLEENTIVIYLSDNGPNGWRWNGGMKGRKGSTDEGGVRSPMIIQWPGNIEAGKQVKQIAGAIDLLPTLVDLAGIVDYHTNKALDGISLKPLLLQQNAAWKDRFIFSFWDGHTSVRSQQYRLDDAGNLFDMVNDQGQRQDIAGQKPDIAKELKEAVETWKKEVLAELPRDDDRPIPLGHAGSRYTQLLADDGIAHGNIRPSNRFPNSSFFTNWRSVADDKITWDVEVLADGDFEVILYYTCAGNDTGSTVEISFGKSKLAGKVTEAHDPPLTGMEHDRVGRKESFLKDFKALKLGTMRLEKGKDTLTLRALDVPGSQVMDFRLMMFVRRG